jgi:hypothetical protein
LNEKEKMDDKLFEEMLREIDAMTKEEYLALFNEAQRIPDFLTDRKQSSIDRFRP